MNNKKKSSVYFDKNNCRWKCAYYVVDKESLVEKRKTKSFMTEEEANQYANIIECQRGNTLFIKNNGILIGEILKYLADQKFEANIIKERSIFSTNV